MDLDNEQHRLSEWEVQRMARWGVAKHSGPSLLGQKEEKSTVILTRVRRRT